MKLYLKNGDSVRLVGMRTIKTAKGNDLTFVTLCNINTFESNDFVLDAQACPPNSLAVGFDYNMILDVGRFTNVCLLPVKK